MSTKKYFQKIHKPTLSYTLFLHLMELKIRKKRFRSCLSLIKSKLLVTDTLISQTKNRNNFTDLETLRQERIFSNRLKLSMLRILSQKKSGPLHREEKRAKVAVIRRRDDDDEVNHSKRQKLNNIPEEIESTDFKGKTSSRRALFF